MIRRVLRWVEANPGASGFLSFGVSSREALAASVIALRGDGVELYLVPAALDLAGADPAAWIMTARASWRRV